MLINATIMSSLKNLYPNFCSTTAKIIWRLGCFVLYRSFLSSKNSQLQNEWKWVVFGWHWKNQFHVNGFALSLAFCSTTAKIIWRLGCFVLYRSFLSSKNSQLQNEWKWVVFGWHWKNQFHVNGFALSLALKQRLGATLKWPREVGVGWQW